MKQRERTSWVSAVLGSAVLGWCGTAGAQAGSASTAETLFREGREAVKRGDYAVACPKFAESQRLDPANGTLLNLALCEEGLGHLVEARTHLREVLAASDLDEQRRAIAIEHAEALDRKMTSPEAPGTAPDPPPEPAPESPGTAGSASLPAPGPTAPPQRDTEPASSTSPHAAVYVLGGLGLLSLTTCAVTGILVIDRADTVNAHCPGKFCDDEGLAAAASGRTLSAVSTATFGIGVALTALSAYFLLQPSKASPRSAVTVGGLPNGARVTWVREF